MIRSSWRRRFERLTDLVRVETQGKVSLGRVVAVARYTEQTSALRRAAVVLLSPLPSLIVTLMIELIPLAPPDWKHRCHWGYLVRLLSTSFVCTYSCLNQFTHYLQSLPESRQYLIPRTLLIAIGNVACIVPIIYWIAFPIPFSAVTTSPSWVACILGDMAIVCGKAFRNRFRELKEPIAKTFKVWLCQFNLIGIYPVYYFMYRLLGASERVILMFLLPIIKIALRIWFSNSVTHLRDELPEVVVTNVDVFNALFMMYCMQITPSLMTTLGLMILDFAQSIFSLYDIRVILLKVNDSYDQIAKGSVVLPRSSSYVTRAAAIISPTYKPATGKEVVRGKESVHIAMTAESKVQVRPHLLLRGKRVTPISPQMGVNDSILPRPATLTTIRTLPGTPRNELSLGPTMPLAETHFVDGVRQLVYIAEFLLLLNYIEFIIPVIYATYLAVVYQLSNRIYFLHIDSMTTEHLNSTLASLYLYAGLELVSLLLLHIVLSRVFHLPGLAQLAYTLETQCASFQSKLIF